MEFFFKFIYFILISFNFFFFRLKNNNASTLTTDRNECLEFQRENELFFTHKTKQQKKSLLQFFVCSAVGCLGERLRRSKKK